MLARILAMILVVGATETASAGWVQISTGTNAQLNDVHSLAFYGSGGFAIAGNGGLLLRTVDEGIHWTQPLVGASADFYRVHSMSSTQYYLSGTDGKVYRALDVALTWTDVSPSTSTRLIVYSQSSGAPRVVGSDGSSRRDEDPTIAGIDWVPQTTGTTQSLNDATGSYSVNVYAVGNGGTILYSANGIDWTPQTSGTTEDLYDILPVGSAYIVFGANGTILRTTDAGTTWVPIASGTSEHLYEAATSVAGISRIMAVGANGTALYSEDSGLTWCRQDTGTSEDLRGVISQGGVLRWYAVGSNGVFLHNDDVVDCAVSVGVEGTPRVLALDLAAAPNPFNPRTTVTFVAPVGGRLSLHIYDARGSLVRTLLERDVQAGPGAVVWDGRSDAGVRVASGVYYAELRGSGLRDRLKLALVE